MWLVSGPLRGHNILLVTEDNNDDNSEIEDWRVKDDHHRPGRPLRTRRKVVERRDSKEDERVLDLDVIVKRAAKNSVPTPILLTTQRTLLYPHTTPPPPHHTRGKLLATFLIFYRDPIQFLNLLAHNKDWNPQYLVLICLNARVNTTSVLSEAVVQRSQFILLLHQQRNFHLQTYTSFPTQRNALGHSLIKAPLGRWTTNTYRTREWLFPPRFSDFGGQVLQVSALCADEPFVFRGKDGNCTGMNVDTLEIIADKLGFRFTFDPPEDFEWGLKQNGTWNGLFGHMLYNDKHLIINEMQPTNDRANDFDYTYPYWEDGFAIMVPNPPSLPRWKNVLYPFSNQTWIFLLLTTVINSILLSLFLKYINSIDDPIGTSLKILAGLVSQAAPMLGEVQEVWARLWLICWWLCVDIFCSMYSGNLVACLTVTVFPPILRTTQDLATSDIRLAMPNYGSFVPDALRESDNPAYASLGKTLLLPPTVDSNDVISDLVPLLMKGDHAIIVTLDYVIYNWYTWDICRGGSLNTHHTPPPSTHISPTYWKMGCFINCTRIMWEML
ncbi:hypothetical protein Pmani_019045 [Petrolisthes manimaculis]|uniref:Ionotropic glutamate receptor L-glutamate and glycine-binding domain-containing protein n=1 Tax=Petrolisthes manimaculis TaxID=1843537 RepID=A0AAE1U7U1_9EUCA|nr:hypothetical protein Pmani_019045 [Petrolisthes manimaculis]